MKKVTVREVAALAGVSPATVSRALNDHPAITAQTKAAVRDACRALHYVPDMTARGLSGHRTHTLGVIVPDISNPYFSAICNAIEGCAAARGYRVMLANTLHDPARELEAVDQMMSQRVDGLVISACTPRSQAAHGAILAGTPCVYIGSNHGSGCSYVEADNARGAYEATQYLHHLGHREIVFLGGRSGSRTLEQRLEGYRRSMGENGLVPRELVAPVTAGKLREWCRVKARECLERNQIPDAILAYSDMMAMEVLGVVEEFGLRAPWDLSVIGFDNASFGRLPQIHLTSVSLRKFHAGRLAVERLLEQIEQDGGRTEDLLRPELMIRSTCRRLVR